MSGIFSTFLGFFITIAVLAVVGKKTPNRNIKSRNYSEIDLIDPSGPKFRKPPKIKSLPLKSGEAMYNDYEMSDPRLHPSLEGKQETLNLEVKPEVPVKSKRPTKNWSRLFYYTEVLGKPKAKIRR